MLGLGGGCVPDGTSGSEAICLIFQLITFAIVIRALLSWFQLDPNNPLIQALAAITDPVIDPIRRVMPRLGMFDLSPFVAIILIQFLISPVFQKLMINAGV